jgi:uncharacterized membrane protein YdbT with pleckstrin-like domain
MGYVEQVLQPGETVIYETTLHWLVYLRSLVFFALAILCLMFAGGLEPSWFDTGLKIGAALLCVLGIVSALSALIQRATTELAVTDRRVIFKTGIFRRHTVEMNLSKVETVGVNQSILGRLLNYGTVIVRGTGGSFEPIPFIGEPLTFRNHITAG